ncbi:hypothetical protein CHS0354_017558 [Potamilus streckersoni]|uniref:Uncharacterized protein n=1 Tax=Potamilus streckersoni TaxID=2493646 RepID=A0AAE0WD01_9BIVA|nr:hypothetical protein CHS0354_017558 [Potamilus streckersoni]
MFSICEENVQKYEIKSLTSEVSPKNELFVLSIPRNENTDTYPFIRCYVTTYALFQSLIDIEGDFSGEEGDDMETEEEHSVL